MQAQPDCNLPPFFLFVVVLVVHFRVALHRQGGSITLLSFNGKVKSMGYFSGDLRLWANNQTTAAATSFIVIGLPFRVIEKGLYFAPTSRGGI